MSLATVGMSPDLNGRSSQEGGRFFWVLLI